MEEKDIERYNIFGDTQNNNVNPLPQQSNLNGTVDANQIWPNQDFTNTPNPADLLKKDIENSENISTQNTNYGVNMEQSSLNQMNVENNNINTTNVQTIQNSSNNTVDQSNSNVSQENINTQSTSVQQNNVKESPKENKNGYKESKSNVFIIVIFVLLALFIIFLPQLSSFIK